MCSYPHAQQQSCPAVSGCFSSEPSRAKAWRRSGRRLISRWVALQAQENFSVWKKCFFSFLDKIKILAFHLLLNVRQNKIRLLCSLVSGCQMNWFHQSFEFSEKMGEDQCNLKHLEMTVKKQMGFFFLNEQICVSYSAMMFTAMKCIFCDPQYITSHLKRESFQTRHEMKLLSDIHMTLYRF